MKTRSVVLVITATLAIEIGPLAQNAAPAAATAASSDGSATIFDPTIKAIQNPDNLAIPGKSGDVAVRNLVPFIQVAATDDRFRVNLLSQLEQNRVDKQVGPASGQNGTTNAVTKGSVPWLIGLAQEYGGMTQSTSGNTTTFKLNPINLIAALNADTNYLDSYTAGNSTFMVKYLRLLTVGFSFNTGSQSSGVTSSSTGGLTNSNSFTGFTAHYDIYNRRDPRDPKWKNSWGPIFSTYGKPTADSIAKVQAALLGEKSSAAFTTWLADTRTAVEAVKKSSSDDILKVLQSRAQELKKIIVADPAAQTAVDQAAQSLLTYSGARNNLIGDIMKSTIVSAEYDLIKQSNQPLVNTGGNTTVSTSQPVPDLSNFNLIIETPFFKTTRGSCINPVNPTAKPDPANPNAKCNINYSQFTANASTTLFNSIPRGSGTGRVRDYQLSGQLDIPIGIINQDVSDVTASLSGVFLSLLQQPLGQPVQVNGVNVNTKGNIGLFQAKLSVKLKNSGVEIPISFTYATRTQLIKESDVRGNVGVTFNLDKLFAGAQANKQ
jgi:hypothetical protein